MGVWKPVAENKYASKLWIEHGLRFDQSFTYCDSDQYIIQTD